jgi:hypothetical protein
MTSNISPITAASNDGDTTSDERERPRHGPAAFRETETKALVHLGMDALSEAYSMGHELHQLLYRPTETGEDRREELLADTLTCMERAEHYLLMLSSVFEEHPARTTPLTAALNK